MVAVFDAPEPTLAQSSNDIIPGGFRLRGEAVDHCTANNYQFKDILNYYGISCGDVAQAKIASSRTGADLPMISSRDHNSKLLSMGRNPTTFDKTCTDQRSPILSALLGHGTGAEFI